MKKWLIDLWFHRSIIEDLENEIKDLKKKIAVKDGKITTLSNDNNDCKKIIIDAAETLRKERVEKNKFKLKNAILQSRVDDSL